MTRGNHCEKRDEDTRPVGVRPVWGTGFCVEVLDLCVTVIFLNACSQSRHAGKKSL